MLILIGGIAALIVGVIWAAVAWSPLLSILAGIVPIILILGGLIAAYFGYDELRYPPPKVSEEEKPAREKAAETPAVSPDEQIGEVAAGERGHWLLGYSQKHIEVVRDKEIISLPSDRSELLRNRMKIGDRVILYATSPVSRFAGIVEISGEPEKSPELPFTPSKKGELWEEKRDVRVIHLPAADAWLEPPSLLAELALLEKARKSGKDLNRSFAAKLREIPSISAEDYGRIERAFGV